jgi:hypothetical protein
VPISSRRGRRGVGRADPLATIAALIAWRPGASMPKVTVVPADEALARYREKGGDLPWTS